MVLEINVRFSWPAFFFPLHTIAIFLFFFFYEIFTYTRKCCIKQVTKQLPGKSCHKMILKYRFPAQILILQQFSNLLNDKPASVCILIYSLLLELYLTHNHSIASAHLMVIFSDSSWSAFCKEMCQYLLLMWQCVIKVKFDFLIWNC